MILMLLKRVIAARVIVVCMIHDLIQFSKINICI